MVKYFILLGFLLGAAEQELQGQLSPIQTDRPDQTECPFIVPAKWLQAENGFLNERVDKTEKKSTHPSVLWRLGISRNLEVRLITEFTTERNGNTSRTGLNPLAAGVKIKIAEEKGLLPEMALIGHLTSGKLGSRYFKNDYTAPSFRFTMQHSLSETVSLSYNVGAAWDGQSPETAYLYTLSTGFSITSKLGAYTELYGFAPEKSRADHRADAGVTYLLSDHFMLDASAGLGITKKNAPENYYALGFSYRFRVLK